MRNLLLVTVILFGGLASFHGAAQAGGWTNTGGLAWFK